MFVRVKSTPKSPKISVQVVESKRIGGKVRQRTVITPPINKHIGVALNDEELKKLKALANSIKNKLKLD